MFKKLDKLVLGAFTGPFVLTFCVVLFIFHSQYMINQFVHLMGKDLGWDVIAELFFYFALALVPVAFPLAMLLASLMTFGNLGQYTELTAIKSCGISLLRVLRPAGILALLLTVVGLIYNDTLLPWANLKGYSLLYDIKQTKPTLNLSEGTFYSGLDGFTIRVDRKVGDGKSLEGIMIYDHSKQNGNTDLILAKSGTMEMVNKDRFLLMRLYNGTSYNENEDYASGTLKKQHIKTGFDTAQIFLSLDSYGLQKTKEELFLGHNLMKNISQLQTEQDSLQKATDTYNNSLVSSFGQQFYYAQPTGTNKMPASDSTALRKTLAQLKDQTPMQAIDGLKRYERATVYSTALSNATSFESIVGANASRIQQQRKDLAHYQLDIQRKYSTAVAIFMMFLIGAPLGAIIKKGGLGIPTLISVFFFVVYYVSTNMGLKLARELVIQPWLGAWGANMLLATIGLLLLWQAKNDVRLLEADYYKVLVSKFRKKKA